jgi:hypothetical protein
VHPAVLSGSATVQLGAVRASWRDANWPQVCRCSRSVSDLFPAPRLGRGVLIVNHQHRLESSQRAPQVYSRPEFVAALTVPVVSTRTLSDWWRVADWAAVRDAILEPA